MSNIPSAAELNEACFGFLEDWVFWGFFPTFNLSHICGTRSCMYTKYVYMKG